MVIDTSALVSVIYGEDDANAFAQALETTAVLRIPATAYVELNIVLGRDKSDFVDRIMDMLDLRIVPIDSRIAHEARNAHIRYGRGSGSPAKLNFGDCFSYATARVLDEPLLYKGQDFVHTDIVSALGSR